MVVFDYGDYKEFLKAVIAVNKGQKAYQSKLAEAMECQKSYLSQVLNSSVHLTPDHAASLADFLSLNEGESTYFMDLVMLSRAGSRKLQQYLRARLKRAKQKRGDPTQKFEWPTLQQRAGTEIYYSAWHWAAVHIMVSIERFSSALAIAQHLRLPIQTIETTLKWLEDQKLIAKFSQGWKVTEKMIYLPNSSPMTEAHHINWRQRGISNIQLLDRAALHYSGVFALSASDFDRLKEFLVDRIADLNQVIGPSECEEVACFTCDLFKL